MDNRDRERDLGVSSPVSRQVQNDVDWGEFQIEFKDLMKEVFQFIDDSARSDSTDMDVVLVGSLLRHLCGIWMDVKSNFTREGQSEDQVVSNARELIVALTRFGLFSLEPKKPSGIGSKSKDSDYSERRDPLLLIDRILQDINALQIELTDCNWTPINAKSAVLKTTADLLETKRILRDAVMRSKNKSFRETCIYNNLVALLGSDERAKEVMNQLLNEMKSMDMKLNENAFGWEDRVRQFSKRYEQ